VRNYASLQVRDVLARLTGVGEVRVFGSGDYAMRVWLDPNKVAAKGLTASDVVAAIREQNVQVAAGAVGQHLDGLGRLGVWPHRCGCPPHQVESEAPVHPTGGIGSSEAGQLGVESRHHRLHAGEDLVGVEPALGVRCDPELGQESQQCGFFVAWPIGLLGVARFGHRPSLVVWPSIVTHRPS